jgi:flagellar hook-length control protein FliK
VLTLSTYEVPQPVLSPVSEPPQVHELEEIDEHEYEDFSKLLAGFIQAEKRELSENTVAVVELSDSEINAAALIGETALAEIITSALPSVDAEELNVQEEIPFMDIPEDSNNILSNMRSFLGLEDTEPVETGFDAALPQDLGDTGKVKNAAFAAESRVSSAMLNEEAAAAQKVPATEAAVQNNTAAVKEVLASEKPRQKENTESASSLRRSEETASLRKDNETDSRVIRTDDMRSRSRKDRLTFDVRDYRTAANTTNNTNASSGSNVAQINAGLDITHGRVQNAPVQEITLELRLPENNSISSGNNTAQTTWQLATSAEAKASAAMENMLARELHQNFNGDIVRHASMALRDGGEGTIKIALKPESLGNVKIHLEMSENKITGQIIVESEEALNAFKKEIASLEQAFKEAGFNSANLNLSLTADGRNADLYEQAAETFNTRTIASKYEDSFEQELPLYDYFMGHQPGALNMLA